MNTSAYRATRVDQQPAAPLIDSSNIMGKSLGFERASSSNINEANKQNNSGITGNTNRKHRLKQRFNVVRKLGKGTYGKVQLAINKETGQEVAIKTIKKTKIESEQDLVRIRREIQIMSSIEHPHIVHIYEVFENKDKIVLVMQYASGGELYEYVSQCKLLDDNEARRLFRQIATAIYYCHQNKICHRDLKLENILLDERNNAKIADFGLSNVFASRHYLRTFCGSPLYASPEIVNGSPYIGPEVDCWSLGVLLYTLVYGAMPFDGSNFKRLVKQISEASYFEPKQKSLASPLIRKLLTCDPEKRATIIDICLDPWVNGQNPHDMVATQSLHHHSLLKVAEDMANLTPVRFDILVALAPVSPPATSDESNQQQQANLPQVMMASNNDGVINVDNANRNHRVNDHGEKMADNDYCANNYETNNDDQQSQGQKRINSESTLLDSSGQAGRNLADSIQNLRAEDQVGMLSPAASFVVRTTIQPDNHQQQSTLDDNTSRIDALSSDTNSRNIKRTRISSSCRSVDQMMTMSNENINEQSANNDRKQINSDDEEDGKSDTTTTNEQQQQKIEFSSDITVEPMIIQQRSPIVLDEIKIVTSETVINLPPSTPEPLVVAQQTKCDDNDDLNGSVMLLDNVHGCLETDKSSTNDEINEKGTDASNQNKQLANESDSKQQNSETTDVQLAQETLSGTKVIQIDKEELKPETTNAGAIKFEKQNLRSDETEQTVPTAVVSTGEKKKGKKKIIVKKKKKVTNKESDSTQVNNEDATNKQQPGEKTCIKDNDNENIISKQHDDEMTNNQQNSNVPVTTAPKPPKSTSRSSLLLGKSGPGKLKIPESFKSVTRDGDNSASGGAGQPQTAGLELQQSSSQLSTRRGSIPVGFKSIVNVADVTKKIMSQSMPKAQTETPAKPAPIDIGATLVKVSHTKAVFERKASQCLSLTNVAACDTQNDTIDLDQSVNIMDNKEQQPTISLTKPMDRSLTNDDESMIPNNNNLAETTNGNERVNIASPTVSGAVYNASEQLADFIINLEKLRKAAENENDSIESIDCKPKTKSIVTLKMTSANNNNGDDDDEDEVVVTLPSPSCASSRSVSPLYKVDTKQVDNDNGENNKDKTMLDEPSTDNEFLTIAVKDKRSDSMETLKADVGPFVSMTSLPTAEHTNATKADNSDIIRVDVDFDVEEQPELQKFETVELPERRVQSTFQIKLAPSTSKTSSAINTNQSSPNLLCNQQSSMDSLSSSHLATSGGQKKALAPIARSYKKVTFTRDGACITETGKIYSSEANDGTFTRVERKSKITHYPESPPSSNNDLTTRLSNYNATNIDDNGKQPFSTLLGNEGIKEPHIIPLSFEETNKQPMTQQTIPNRNNDLIRSGSESSCSSGSTDAFDDIFDKWTGGDQFFNRNFMKMKNMFKLPPISFNHHSPFAAMPPLPLHSKDSSNTMDPFQQQSSIFHHDGRDHNRHSNLESLFSSLKMPQNNTGSRILNNIMNSKDRSSSFFDDDHDLDDAFDHHFDHHSVFNSTLGRRHSRRTREAGSSWKGSTPSLFSSQTPSYQELDPMRPSSLQQQPATQGIWRFIKPGLDHDQLDRELLHHNKQQQQYNQSSDNARDQFSAASPEPTRGPFSRIISRMYSDMGSNTRRRQPQRQQQQQNANNQIKSELFVNIKQPYNNSGSANFRDGTQSADVDNIVYCRPSTSITTEADGSITSSADPLRAGFNFKPSMQQQRRNDNNSSELPSPQCQSVPLDRIPTRRNTVGQKPPSGRTGHFNNLPLQQSSSRASLTNRMSSISLGIKRTSSTASDNGGIQSSINKQVVSESERMESDNNGGLIKQRMQSIQSSGQHIDASDMAEWKQHHQQCQQVKYSASGDKESFFQQKQQQRQQHFFKISPLDGRKQGDFKNEDDLSQSYQHCDSGDQAEIPSNEESSSKRVEHWLRNSMNNIGGQQRREHMNDPDNEDHYANKGTLLPGEDIPGTFYYNNSRTPTKTITSVNRGFMSAMSDDDYSRNNPLHMYATLGRDPSKKAKLRQQQQQQSRVSSLETQFSTGSGNVNEQQQHKEQLLMSQRQASSFSQILSRKTAFNETEEQEEAYRLEQSSSSKRMLSTSHGMQSQEALKLSSSSNQIFSAASRSSEMKQHQQIISSVLPPSGMFSLMQQRSNSTLANSSSFVGQSISSRQFAVSSEQSMKQNNAILQRQQYEKDRSKLIKYVDNDTDGTSVSSKSATITLEQQRSSSSVTKMRQQSSEERENEELENEEDFFDQQQHASTHQSTIFMSNSNNRSSIRQVTLSAPIDGQSFKWSTSTPTITTTSSSSAAGHIPDNYLDNFDDDDKEPVSLLEQLRARGYRSIVNQRLSRKQVESPFVSSSTIESSASIASSSTISLNANQFSNEQQQQQQQFQMMTTTEQYQKQKQQRQRQLTAMADLMVDPTKTSVSLQQSTSNEQHELQPQQPVKSSDNCSSALGLSDNNDDKQSTLLDASTTNTLEAKPVDKMNDDGDNNRGNVVFGRTHQLNDHTKQIHQPVAYHFAALHNQTTPNIKEFDNCFDVASNSFQILPNSSNIEQQDAGECDSIVMKFSRGSAIKRIATNKNLNEMLLMMNCLERKSYDRDDKRDLEKPLNGHGHSIMDKESEMPEDDEQSFDQVSIVKIRAPNKRSSSSSSCSQSTLRASPVPSYPISVTSINGNDNDLNILDSELHDANCHNDENVSANNAQSLTIEPRNNNSDDRVGLTASDCLDNILDRPVVSKNNNNNHNSCNYNKQQHYYNCCMPQSGETSTNYHKSHKKHSDNTINNELKTTTIDKQNNQIIDINGDQSSTLLPLYPIYSHSYFNNDSDNNPVNITNNIFNNINNQNNNINNQNNNHDTSMNLNSLDGGGSKQSDQQSISKPMMIDQQLTTRLMNDENNVIPITDDEEQIQHGDAINCNDYLIDDRSFSPMLSRTYLDSQLKQMKETQQFLETLKQQERLELQQRQANYFETLNSLETLAGDTTNNSLLVNNTVRSTTLNNMIYTNGPRLKLQSHHSDELYTSSSLTCSSMLEIPDWKKLSPSASRSSVKSSMTQHQQSTRLNLINRNSDDDSSVRNQSLISLTNPGNTGSSFNSGKRISREPIVVADAMSKYRRFPSANEHHHRWHSFNYPENKSDDDDDDEGIDPELDAYRPSSYKPSFEKTTKVDNERSINATTSDETRDRATILAEHPRAQYASKKSFGNYSVSPSRRTRRNSDVVSFASLSFGSDKSTNDKELSYGDDNKNGIVSVKDNNCSDDVSNYSSSRRRSFSNSSSDFVVNNHRMSLKDRTSSIKNRSSFRVSHSSQLLSRLNSNNKLDKYDDESNRKQARSRSRIHYDRNKENVDDNHVSSSTATSTPTTTTNNQRSLYEKKSKLSELEERIKARKKRTLSLLSSLSSDNSIKTTADKSDTKHDGASSAPIIKHQNNTYLRRDNSPNGDSITGGGSSGTRKRAQTLNLRDDDNDDAKLNKPKKERKFHSSFVPYSGKADSEVTGNNGDSIEERIKRKSYYCRVSDKQPTASYRDNNNDK